MEEKLNYHFTYDPDAPAVISTSYQKLTVDRGINSSRTVQFTVESQDDSFIDMSQCYVKTVLRVVTASGDSVPANATVYPVPYFSNMLWSQVNISLNGTPLPPNGEYGHTATLIDLLGTSKEKRENSAALTGSVDSHYGNSYVKNTYEDSLLWHKNHGKSSEPWAIYDRIHSDVMMSCGQLLANKFRLGITLIRAKDSLVLVKSPEDTTDYKVDVQSVSLYVKRIHLNQAAVLMAEKKLAQGGKLQYQRLHTLAFNCNEGSRTWSWHNCFNGVAPRRVFMVLLGQETYFGSWSRFSTYYESAGVSAVRFCLDGREIMSEPYRTNFCYDDNDKIEVMKSDAREAYAGLCRVIGTFFNPRLNMGIEYPEFLDGSTVFAAELDHSHGTEAGQGSLDVHIEFAEPTKESLSILILAEYPKTLHFDANRQVFIF